MLKVPSPRSHGRSRPGALPWPPWGAWPWHLNCSTHLSEHRRRPARIALRTDPANAAHVRACSPQASYTKAIKAEPENHVFFSNRSQAFLKLSKVTKALEDADKCIALAPTFVKGYHRKAR